MKVFIIKFAGGIILWLCIVFFGLLPLRVKHFRTNQTLLSVSNCFSGGLFLSIGLIHILPEAHEKLEGKIEAEYIKQGKEVFPLSYVICLSTFAFILLIDKVIFNSTDDNEVNNYDSTERKKSMIKKQQEIFEEDLYNVREFVSSKYKVALRLSKYRRSKADVLVCEDEEHHRLHSPIPEESDDEASCRSLQSHERLLYKQSLTNKPKIEIAKKEPEFLYSDDNNSNKIQETKRKSSLGHHQNTPVGHHHHHHHHKIPSPDENIFAAYILLLAMGIHGFFAGIAFGISNTYVDTINMFLAMISHKWSEALTVGVSFVAADIAYDKSFFMIIFLSMITPLGIFVGYLLSALSDTVVGIALSISSGTFIYISCAEIIVDEFAFGDKAYWKFFAFILGIIFIAIVNIAE